VYLFVRRILIRTLLPLTWRPFARFRASRLARFGVTEADSAWQILHALDAVDEPSRRVRILQHALEEVHHASEFTRVARPHAPEVLPRLLPPREPIFEREKGLEGLVTFAAYACVGEEDVLAQFDAYAAGMGDGEARAAFREARFDEQGHVGLCRSLLVGLVGEARARREIRWARLRRLWEAWTRLGRDLGEITSILLFGAIYAVFGVIGWLPARARLRAEA
jgi:hypothetical protein